MNNKYNLAFDFVSNINYDTEDDIIVPTEQIPEDTFNAENPFDNIWQTNLRSVQLTATKIKVGQKKTIKNQNKDQK